MTRPSHNAWIKGAEALRDLSYSCFELSVATANSARAFASLAPLDAHKNQYAVALPPKWLGKGERSLALSADFRRMATFVPAHSLPRVRPLNSRTRQLIAESGKLFGSVVYDMSVLTNRHKYVLNRLHRLLDEHPSLERNFSLSLSDMNQYGGRCITICRPSVRAV